MAGGQQVGCRPAPKAGQRLAGGWPKAGRRLCACFFFGAAAAKRRETSRNASKRRKTSQNAANFPDTLGHRVDLVPLSGLQAWRRDPPLPKKIVKSTHENEPRVGMFLLKGWKYWWFIDFQAGLGPNRSIICCPNSKVCRRNFKHEALKMSTSFWQYKTASWLKLK